MLNIYLENIVYHFFRQLWLFLGVKLMEINSNLFSRYVKPPEDFSMVHRKEYTPEKEEEKSSEPRPIKFSCEALN